MVYGLLPLPHRKIRRHDIADGVDTEVTTRWSAAMLDSARATVGASNLRLETCDMARMRWLGVPAMAGCGLLLALVACSSAGGGSGFDDGDGNGGSGAGTAGGSGTGGILNSGGTGGAIDINPPCNSTPDVDADGDGYTGADGDCNDCSPQMNPGAYDFFGNGVDDDCNGVADDEPYACEAGLPIDGNNPLDAARALGLCRFTSDGVVGAQRTWGVISAAYVFADGSVSSGEPDILFGMCTGPGGYGSPPNPMSHGVLTSFGSGVTPRDGESMVALSSGVARAGVNGDSPGGASMCTKSATPPGFPTPSTAACPGQGIDDTPVANDPIALELRVRAPTNAKSLTFDFDFYTYEYPGYICTEYNDFFVALVYSQHPNNPPNKNVSFDSQGNPVSVNNGFLEVCSPGNYGGKSFSCPLGTGELNGTGFEDHAATGWLQTTTAIVPGEELTIRFAVWDMGDEVLDSTVLIDNIKWDVDEGETGTDRPPVK